MLSVLNTQAPPNDFVVPPEPAGQSAPQVPDTAVAAPAPAAEPAPPGTRDYERPVSWKLLAPNLLSDQKNIWLFPVRLATGHNIIPTAAVIAATVTLVAFVDPHEAHYFRNTNTFYRFNQIFSGNNSALTTAIVPLSMYGIGFFTHDTKLKRTALLAGEAIANAEILVTVMKDIDMRLRPQAIALNGNYNDSWFDDRSHILRSGGSFPSGHTIAAFSLATVIAREYGNHKWVPYVAYGLAATVGFSRLTLSAHFTSDVFMGGVLGYAISRFTVLRQ